MPQQDGNKKCPNENCDSEEFRVGRMELPPIEAGEYEKMVKPVRICSGCGIIYDPDPNLELRSSKDAEVEEEVEDVEEEG